jgi:hypothetical protein
MDDALFFPSALNHGVSQHTEQLCRIDSGANLDIDPSL